MYSIRVTYERRDGSTFEHRKALPGLRSALKCSGKRGQSWVLVERIDEHGCRFEGLARLLSRVEAEMWRDVVLPDDTDKRNENFQVLARVMHSATAKPHKNRVVRIKSASLHCE